MSWAITITFVKKRTLFQDVHQISSLDGAPSSRHSWGNRYKPPSIRSSTGLPNNAAGDNSVWRDREFTLDFSGQSRAHARGTSVVREATVTNRWMTRESILYRRLCAMWIGRELRSRLALDHAAIIRQTWNARRVFPSLGVKSSKGAPNCLQSSTLVYGMSGILATRSLNIAAQFLRSSCLSTAS